MKKTPKVLPNYGDFLRLSTTVAARLLLLLAELLASL
jgi:hypothetical protein